jgi:6-phosphofructokinase
MEGNLLVVHGGGPTAVLNASLYGVIREAQASPDIQKIYGAIGGSEAILTENFLDMGELEDEKIELLLQTPGTAIGSSRFPLEQEQYEAMVDILKKNNIKYVLFNGGNGSMDTCGKVSKVCEGEGIYVVGIPKTMDNDISIIDHAPGFPSAAKYIATVTKEVGADVKSLPIHVCVIEAMGRNAGWITAASALARKNPGDAPHLIYLPERNFNEEEFLEDVKKLYEELGGVVVVVSEGLRNEKGESIVPPIFKTDRAVYYGDVSAYLAELVIKKLGIKARSEKPGLCGRTSMLLQSEVDRQEAILVGREAVKAALAGQAGVMVGIKRKAGETYEVETPLIPIEEVMLNERVMPEEYINERGNDITGSFVDWCRPLIDGDLPEMVSFKDEAKQVLKSRI